LKEKRRIFKMKKLLFLVLTAVVLASSSAWGFMDVVITDNTPFAYEKITVTTSSVSMLDKTYRDSARAIFLTVEDNSIRYRIDGGNATSSDGHLLSSSALQNLWLHDGWAIKNLRMIGIDGNATAIVTYYRAKR